MAVPSSGQLRLRGDIALEVDGSATGSNVSLRSLSSTAGFSTPDTMSEFYGYSASVPPTVSTSGATSITNSQFIANGNVSSDGGATITERGFYIGPYGGSNYSANTKYIVSGTTGGYSLTRTGQPANTTLYITAYATNASGTTIGSTVSVATYPTMNYAVATASNAGAHSTYINLWDPGTASASGAYTDTLIHPYLGNISLASTSFSGVNAGTTLTKNGRQYAYKTNNWGSYLARTNWNIGVSIPWPWFQNYFNNGDNIIFHQEWSKSVLTTAYGWAANGTSSSGYGGYGARVFRTGENNTYIQYQTALGNLVMWSLYNQADVYK